MEILPSVDLMGGKVVRLVQGDPDRAKVYSADPVATARRWEQEGASGLHVVDLDAALERGSNLSLVEAILKAVSVDVEVGGGVRSLPRASRLLKAGADRVILGTAAFSDPTLPSALVKQFGGERVMAALDYREGTVVVRGWRETSKDLVQALNLLRRKGVRKFLLTDVNRDGTLGGPDVETLRRIARTRGVEVVASGGIRGLTDLAALKQTGVTGVVVGTALYEGLFSLQEAFRAVGE